MSAEQMKAFVQSQIAMINRSEVNFEEFRKSQNLKLPALTPQDLSNHNVIVTGANAGLGYETAKALASMKPRLLILACRNMEKAKEAAEQIKKDTGCTTIELEELDLASFASAKAFAQRILARNIPIDILVSNAGVAGFAGWQVTKDGYEIQLQVNHLSNVLMVLSLVPAFRKAKHPRVNIVASGVHFWPDADPTDPNPVAALNTPPKPTEHRQQYASTKLFNVLFAQEFARRFPDIFICSSDPGYCYSELGAKNNETGNDKTHRPNYFESEGIPMRETAEGAKTFVHVVISPEITQSGGFFSDMGEHKARSITLGEGGKKFGANLWKETMDILEKVAPKLPQN